MDDPTAEHEFTPVVRPTSAFHDGQWSAETGDDQPIDLVPTFAPSTRHIALVPVVASSSRERKVRHPA